MTPKFVTDYLCRSHRELKKLSSKENMTIPYLWYDFIKSSLLHGVIIKHYTRGKFYTLKGCERKKSLTYGRIVKLFDTLNSKEAIPTLNEKHRFNKFYSKYVRRGWLHSTEMTFEDFCNLCDNSEELIIKPDDGVEGVGVKKIASPPSSAHMNSRKALFEEIRKHPSMVEECIKQHPQMIFNNTSVNTIRANTLIDKNGEVQMLKVLFRVGVGNSVVDNYAQGGCVYEVHPVAGKIISPSLNLQGEEVYVHPGTETFMLGHQIPKWDEVVAAVKDAHSMLPGCRFIGWDVAITEKGVELIEGNHNPEYAFFEFFGTKGWYQKIQNLIK